MSDVATTPASDSDSFDAAETLTAEATETQATPDPSEAQAGPPRDEHGRFRARAGEEDETDPATDTAPDGAQDAPAPDDPDAPAAPPGLDPDSAPTATVGQAALAPAPKVSPDAAADQPFTFPHRGQQYAVPGSRVEPDGSIVIPAAQRRSMELMLSRAREHDVAFPQVRAQWEREAQTLRAQLDQRHAGIEAFGRIFEGSPDLETVLTRTAEFFEAMPALKEQMTRDELAARDRRIAELEGRAPQGPNGQNAQPAPPSGPTQEQLEHWIRGGTIDALLTARQELPEFKEFSDAELEALGPKLLAKAKWYVEPATPEDEQLYGHAPGTPIIRGPAFVDALRFVAQDTLKQKQAAAAKAKLQPKLDAAARHNAAVLSPSKAPPVPRAASEVGVGGGADKEYKSYADWQQDFLYRGRRAG